MLPAIILLLGACIAWALVAIQPESSQPEPPSECNGQLKLDTFLGSLSIKYALKF